MEKPIEISLSQLGQLDKDMFEIVDIRPEDSFIYGHIPGAKNIPSSQILDRLADFSPKKDYILYCKSGSASQEVAVALREKGVCAFSLAGGYMAYIKANIIRSEGKAAQVEESIRKKFHRKIFSKFCKAINDYQLLKPHDKVAICISGGKDSMLMAKLFQELKRHNKFEFELVFLVMDPGYSPQNREIIEANAKLLGVPITIFESDIFDSVFHIEKSPCYLCARMRRGHLYSKAKELGCNKIALGHHYDDVIETILMGMLYGGQVQTMMPKLRSTNFAGMELIRPMYLIREADIKAWRDANGLDFIQCACKFTDTCSGENCTIGQSTSKRKLVKDLIASLKKVDPQIEQNIFASVENVNLSTIIAYKDKEGKEHHFLDEYDQ